MSEYTETEIASTPNEFGPRRRRVDPVFDYKDIKQLKRFLSEDGKILPRRRTGLSAKAQRRVSLAIKRARHLAMVPYSTRD